MTLARAGGIVLAAAALLASAAAAAQTPIAHGRLLAFQPLPDRPWRVIDLQDGRTLRRLPPGPLAGGLVVHRDGDLLTWFDVATGARVADAVVQAHGRFALVGASQDGREAVLARTQTRSTTFAIVGRHGEREVTRPGRRRFAALSGRRLTLVRRVPGAIVAASSSRRYVWMLYAGGTLRAVDSATGAVRDVRLVGGGAAYALAVDSSGTFVWAASPSEGRVYSVDGSAHVLTAFRFAAGHASASAAAAAISPDGEHLAVSDGGHVWIVVPATRSVSRLAAHVAIALGWSPDQQRLWVVGERSRLSPLRPRLR